MELSKILSTRVLWFLFKYQRRLNWSEGILANKFPEEKNGTASLVKFEAQEAEKRPWKQIAYSALLSSTHAMKLLIPQRIL